MLVNNKQLGLWYRPRLNSERSWLVALVVAMGSIRGLIVINANIPAATVYMLTAASLLILAAYGWIKSGGYKNPDLALLKNLLQLNMLLGIVNIASGLLLGEPFALSDLYVYLAPYVVFLFLRVPTRYLNVAVVVITIAISYSVGDNFIETLKGPEGLHKVLDYNSKLRPDLFESLSRTGEFYRASGYTGSYHDSANILGMAVSFFFIRFLLKKKMSDLWVFLFAMVSLTLTQSAANILVAIFTLLIFAGYIMIRNRKMSTYVYLLLGVMSIIALIVVFGDTMSIFTARLNEEGDWEGMMNSLDMSSLLSSVPFLLSGHAAAFSIKIITVEVAHLKAIFQLGIIHSTILFWILLYPIIRFVKLRPLCYDALPSAAAIFFGFMSLLHYGSLFRVTSIFLFYALYAICLNNIIKCGKSMHLSQSPKSETAI